MNENDFLDVVHDKRACSERQKHVEEGAENESIFAVIEQDGVELSRARLLGEVTIGRGKSCDIRLMSNALARAHARVFYSQGRFIVVDLDTTNGTFIDEKRVTKPQVFDENECVQFGDYVLRIIREGA